MRCTSHANRRFTGRTAGLALAFTLSIVVSSVRPARATGSAHGTPISLGELRPTVDAIGSKCVEPSGGLFGRKPKIVGLVVGIVQDGERAVFGYGTVDHDSARVPDGDTAFEIGSITKTFTGVLLADAVRRGEVHLTDAVADHLPSEVAAKAHRVPPITLVDLATHTSGLPRLPANLDPKDLDDPYADFDEAALWKYLEKRGLKRDDDPDSEYSNLGMGLLGHTLVLSAESRPATWEELVAERILRPLNMNDTHVGWSADCEARRASPYHKWGKRDRIWTFGVLDAAGSLHSTANDMLTWADANLGHGSGGIAESIRASHELHFAMSDRVSSGLAWVVAQPEEIGETVIWHNGRTGGYSSHLALLPQSNLGIVVLANTSSDLIDETASNLVKDILRIRILPDFSG